MSILTERGQRLAAECNWDGSKILELAVAALLEADYPLEAEQVQEILCRVKGGVTNG